MELDTNIMQTKTVGTIIEVLKDINEGALLSNNTKQQITTIIKKNQRAMSLIGSHQR